MELLSDNNIPITFASDAHTPEQIGFKKNEIHELAKSYGYSTCNAFIKKETIVMKF